MHRDLKPENLLFKDKSDDAKIMITDFGLSKIMKSSNDITLWSNIYISKSCDINWLKFMSVDSFYNNKVGFFISVSHLISNIIAF